MTSLFRTKREVHIPKKEYMIELPSLPTIRFLSVPINGGTTEEITLTY
jgi:hypothetical protein